MELKVSPEGPTLAKVGLDLAIILSYAGVANKTMGLGSGGEARVEAGPGSAAGSSRPSRT